MKQLYISFQEIFSVITTKLFTETTTKKQETLTPVKQSKSTIGGVLRTSIAFRTILLLLIIQNVDGFSTSYNEAEQPNTTPILAHLKGVILRMRT